MQAEEEKKEVSAVPETAEGFHRAPEIKHLSRSLPQRCFKRQGGSLSVKKLSVITRNIGRYTELRIQDGKKSQQLLCVWRTQIGICHQDQSYQWSDPKGGVKRKITHFVKDGDVGNREDQINSLIRRKN
ncbi:hypothetical protein E5288_WYG014508 [Bos mutus]|uniref:Uncharacterized protein n=1 Tax=Bos mutus TaxID=72004 RepID=A0A6B0R3F6_9CETA|nr:hypothetical protein [Bos mutus]